MILRALITCKMIRWLSAWHIYADGAHIYTRVDIMIG
jgi:hypothetical protein